MRWNNPTIVTSAIIVVFVAAVLFVAVPFVYENRLSIVRNPLVARFVPIYRSLRKLPDIFFIPVSLFRQSELEEFNLSISPDNIQILNAALPQDPFGDTFLDEEYKRWVSADFSAGDYSSRVDVRYRGNQNGHWNSFKKSYLVKFPKENLFRGMRELTLIIPSDRRYFTTNLNNYRARKLGFIVPDDDFIRLRLNGSDHGVYISLEHWSQEWLEKAGIGPTSILLGVEDRTELDTIPLFSNEGSIHWKSWNVEESPPVFEPIMAIVEIIEHADVETFRKIIPQVIDLDLFLSSDTLHILSGGYHTSNSVHANNVILYFDAIDGRLKPIPYNVSLLGEGSEVFPGTPTELQRRLWEISEFKEERARIFHSYVENEMEDDLMFLEQWQKKMNKEFYMDTAKPDNNIMYKNKISEFIGLVSGYFNDPHGKLDDTDSYELAERDERRLIFSGSFVYLSETILSPVEFVRANPKFVLQNGEIVLPTGTHFFGRDVIVPVDTNLKISAGATLIMGDGVSLVSYSPVSAVGTAINPIRIIAADKIKPWGVFAVINTENNLSQFENIFVRGGKDDTINGVYFSGMLALHNASGVIKNSTFEDAHADDAVNVKKGEFTIENNTFSSNSSDALDADFSLGGSVARNNKFFDNGGDAIDLSWSDIAVENNIIIDCVDKGISVGEQSRPMLSGNIIVRCGIGIASKDSSHTTSIDNILIGNNIALSAYQKKTIYGGGSMEVEGGVLWKNNRDTRVDGISNIGLSNVFYDEPDLTALSSFIQQKILQ